MEADVETPKYHASDITDQAGFPLPKWILFLYFIWAKCNPCRQNAWNCCRTTRQRSSNSTPLTGARVGSLPWLQLTWPLFSDKQENADLNQVQKSRLHRVRFKYKTTWIQSIMRFLLVSQHFRLSLISPTTLRTRGFSRSSWRLSFIWVHWRWFWGLH